MSYPRVLYICRWLALLSGIQKFVPSIAVWRWSMIKKICFARKFIWFTYILPFFIVKKIFHLSFLIRWFIFSNTLEFLYTKFLESVANILAKFRLHTKINFLIQLNYLFSLNFYTLRIIQIGDIELNPGTKTSLSSGLSICNLNSNSLVGHNFSKVNLLQAYNSIHSFWYHLVIRNFLRFKNLIGSSRFINEGLYIGSWRSPVQCQKRSLHLLQKLPAIKRSQLIASKYWVQQRNLFFILFKQKSYCHWH